MPTIALSAHSFRIYERRRMQLTNLDNFSGNEDFLDVINRYLDQIAGTEINARTQKAYQLDFRNDTLRGARGIIKAGAYGFESDLIEVVTGEATHHKTTDEADLVPFYFQYYIPNNSDEGILLLQKFGHFGITGVIRNAVARRFDRSYTTHFIEINSLIPEEVIDEFLAGGRLAELRLIRYTLPTDIANALGRAHEEEECQVELSIKAKRDISLRIRDRAHEALHGRRRVSEIVEVAGFEYSDAKLVIEIGGQQRTLNLADLSKLRPTYNISDEIELGEDGHPTFESLCEAGDNLIGQLSRAIALG